MKTKLFFLLLCLISLPSFAVIRYVNVNVVGGTSDGLLWTNAYNNLQAALTAAAPGDEIWMAQGTYKPVVPANPATPTNAERAIYYTIPAGVKIYGGFAGTETLLNQRNWTVYPTIISGDINNSGTNDTGDSFRLIYMENVGTQTELNGLIIENTYTHYESTYYYGVGIANVANGAISSPRVTNCIIRNHHTKGGGSILNIAVSGGDGQPVYTNCIIYNNFGRDASGGIYNRFSGDNPATIAMPVFINCTIVGNGTEDPQLGGAVFNQLYVPGGTFIPVFTNCIIWGNTVHTDTDVPAQSAIYSDPTITPIVTHSNVQGVLVVGMGNLNQDPLFVNQAAGDLRLLCNSPSVNTGNSAANTVPTDIVGSTRISNTIDMGAYELTEVMYVRAGNTATIRNGLSWATAYNENELQTAINQAAAATTCGVIQVWVAQGTYQPSTTDMSISYAMKNKVEIYGGFVGAETTLSSRNYTTNPTILTGANYNYHVILNGGSDIQNSESIDNTAVIDGFIITAGKTMDVVNFPHSYGGGMFNNGNGGFCNPTVRNCKFTSNYGLAGGAIYNSGFQGTSSPKFINCSFSNNSASSGGVMFNFTNLNGTSSPSLINCSLSKNSAQSVGGIYSNQVTGEIKPVLTNCILWNNTDGLSNTQIFNEGGATPIITYCDIQSNGTDAVNHNIDQNPLFVDATNNDLRLQPCSPAINVGNDAANSTTLDLGSNNRKFGVIDLGAYEYQSSPVAQPTASASTTTAVICSGGTINLSATGGNNFSWAGPSNFNSTQQNPNFVGSSTSYSGLYSVTVSNDNCPLTATATVSVQVNPNPVSTPSSNSPICTGQTLQLSATAGSGAYSWSATGYSSTQQNPSRPSATTAMSGVYKLTVVSNSCTTTATISVLVISQLIASISPSSTQNICVGVPLSLTASGGSPYSWSGPGNFNSTNAVASLNTSSTSYSGVYKVTVGSSVCTATATVSVNIQQATVNISPNPLSVCIGESINLSSTTANAYSWRGPGGFSSRQQNISNLYTFTGQLGIYSLTVTVGNCTASTTAEVKSKAQLNAGVQGGLVCIGGTIQLTASGMNSYSWTRPANNFSSTLQNPVIPSAKLTDAGAYLVTGRSGSCTGSAMVLVLVNSPTINPEFTVSPSSIAQGAAITLSATSATGTYSWSGPAGFSGSTRSKTISSFQAVNNGVYRLTLTSGLCKGYTEKTLTISTATRLAGGESEEEIDMEINAYPNPVTNTLSVEVRLKESQAIQLKLYNMVGQPSGTWQLDEEATVHKTELNMSELTGGIYLLQAEAGKQKAVKRVVKIQY